MKCCSWTFCVVFLPIVLACIAYYLYTPLPDGLRQKWRIQSFYARYKITSLCISVAEKLGYGTPLELSRKFNNFYMSGKLNEENVTVTKTTLSNIPVMIFRPKRAPEISPAVVYFHGGGWMFHSSETYAGGIADLAESLNAVVVSVDYRLSPEHPFPAAFDDCVAATAHVLQNGKTIGIDVNNVGVAGDSAGGNLAAAVALRLADERNSRLPKLKFQMIIYSVLQGFDFTLPCYSHNELPLFPRSVMVVFILSYLGIEPTPANIDICLNNNHLTPALKKSEYASYVDQKYLPPKFRRTPPRTDDSINNKTFAKFIEKQIINPYVFPLMAKDLSKVPPAFVITCQYDLTRDDGIMYAERLRRADVNVEHKHVTDAVHDFFLRAPNTEFRYDVHLETLKELAVFAKKYFK